MSLGSTEEMRAMSVIVMMAPYPILCRLSQSVKIRRERGRVRTQRGSCRPSRRAQKCACGPRTIG